MKYQELGKGIVKRREKRIFGLFIDGTGLDRATRRIAKRVDMSALVKGVCSGVAPLVARYYTLIPYEDDSRHRAFLDAVTRANLSVVVKRLPPKGITRQVSVEVEMAADIAAFALGHTKFSTLSEYQGHDSGEDIQFAEAQSSESEATESPSQLVGQRVVVVVCPGRDLAYPISLAREVGADTMTADFGQFNQGDVLKSAAKWIDLSDSETIWMGS